MSANQKTHQKPDNHINEINRLGDVINDVQNLVAALQIVNWELCHYPIHEPHLRELRAAVIGLGDALSRVTDGVLEMRAQAKQEGAVE